jgi:hypothetical protein
LFLWILLVAAHDRQSGRICSGVNLYGNRLNVAAQPVYQLDRERE